MSRRNDKPKLGQQIDTAIAASFATMKDFMEKAMQEHENGGVAHEKWVKDFLEVQESKMREECKESLRRFVDSLIQIFADPNLRLLRGLGWRL